MRGRVILKVTGVGKGESEVAEGVSNGDTVAGTVASEHPTKATINVTNPKM